MYRTSLRGQELYLAEWLRFGIILIKYQIGASDWLMGIL